MHQLVAYVVLYMDPAGEKQRRGVSNKVETPSPLLELVLRPLVFRMGERSSLNERVSAAQCLEKITNASLAPSGGESSRDYVDMLDENMSHLARPLTRTLWRERSRAGASLCESVANLATYVSPVSLRPYRKKFIGTLLHRLSDREGSWQTAEAAVRALATLVVSDPSPKFRDVCDVRRLLEDLAQSHKTRKVRSAAKESFQKVLAIERSHAGDDDVESSFASKGPAKEKDSDNEGDDGVEYASGVDAEALTPRIEHDRTSGDGREAKEANYKAGISDDERRDNMDASKLTELRRLRANVKRGIQRRTSDHSKMTAAGTGVRAAAALSEARVLRNEYIDGSPETLSPSRELSEVSGTRFDSLLLNREQVTARSTFTRIEDLVVRQEQMWAELINLQRIVYDPPWLSTLESRVEKLEAMMESALLRIDAVERRQKVIDDGSTRQKKLASWTAETAAALSGSNRIPLATSHHTDKKLSKKIEDALLAQSTKELTRLVYQRPRLAVLSARASSALLEHCSTLIATGRHAEAALPWIEQSIVLRLLPPLLQVPLRRKMMKALYVLSASPTDFGVKAAELYQKGSGLGWCE